MRHNVAIFPVSKHIEDLRSYCVEVRIRRISARTHTRAMLNRPFRSALKMHSSTWLYNDIRMPSIHRGKQYLNEVVQKSCAVARIDRNRKMAVTAIMLMFRERGASTISRVGEYKPLCQGVPDISRSWGRNCPARASVNVQAFRS